MNSHSLFVVIPRKKVIRRHMITEIRKQMHKSGPVSATSKSGTQPKVENKRPPSGDHSKPNHRPKKDIDAERHPEEQMVDPKAFPKVNGKVLRPNTN